MHHTAAPMLYEDVAVALASVTRAVVIGEPGAGKTTTLMKVAREALNAHERDADRPLPLFVRLGAWEQANTTLPAFLAARLGIPTAAFEKALAAGHLLLLLDGLNEIPGEQRAAKSVQLRALLRDHPGLPVLLSCRELDYRNDPNLDVDIATLAVQPLDVSRIRTFLEAHLAMLADDVESHVDAQRLGRERADDLLWQLAGGQRARAVFETWRKAGADETLFFESADIPREDPNVYGATSAGDDDYWRRVVRAPRNLLNLARSPYLLALFARVYDPARGTLPANRAALFEGFVRVLLAREGLGDDASDTGRETRAALLSGLERLAYSMQSEHGTGGEARTTLAHADALATLQPPSLMQRAAGTGLIEVGNTVRFAHQLLQEHFAARALAARLQDTPAERLWPRPHWWQPGGWEEVAVLLAGLESPGCEAVLDWLAEASPPTAARCVAESGVSVPSALLDGLRERWTARLLDARTEPEAAARAALGRALAVEVDGGAMLDARAGVGVCRLDDDRRLPDIDWVDIPAGTVALDGGAGRFAVQPFRMARYPVTNAQFESFVADREGYADERWWTGIGRFRDGPRAPRWNEGNHPRETVTWYEAVAFCRWLSARLAQTGELDAALCVRLPTEWEWQQAATGGEAGRSFPWPGAEDEASRRANINGTGIGRTTAVGIFAAGASAQGLLDMSGNVWEWCLNRYESPGEEAAARVDTSDAPRVLRGGSWRYAPVLARCASRRGYYPDSRSDGVGFRVCCSSPIE